MKTWTGRWRWRWRRRAVFRGRLSSEGGEGGLVGLTGPHEEGVQVGAGEGQGEKPHGGESGEAPAHLLGDGEGLEPLPLGEGAQGALLGVGGHHEVPPPVLPQVRFKPLQEDGEARQGLRRGPRLGDGVHQGLPGVQGAEEPEDGLGLHVVQVVEAHPALVEGGPEGLGPQALPRCR